MQLMNDEYFNLQDIKINAYKDIFNLEKEFLEDFYNCDIKENNRRIMIINIPMR